MTRTVIKVLLAGCWLSCAGCLSSTRVSLEQQETRTLSAEGITLLDIDAHNGRVAVTGDDEADASFTVHVHKIASGHSMEQAQQCLDAIELITDARGETQTLSWRWSTPRDPDCRASVAFDVKAPRRISAKVKTHNGRIQVKGVAGDCDLESHNGRIEVACGGRRIDAVTHNGRVMLSGEPSTVNVQTHNGRIVADLKGAHSVSGRLGTHNGRVRVRLHPGASAYFDCHTRSGSVDSSIGMDVIATSRNSLKARCGDPKDKLVITTHNGSIKLEN